MLATGKPQTPQLFAALQTQNLDDFEGPENCQKCHQEQYKTLTGTAHFKSSETMHRSEKGREIAKAVGLSSIKRSTKCVRCHYTPTAYRRGMKAIAPISCESCHGASRQWVQMHNDYGGKEVKREEETTEHRILRIKSSMERGLRHPSNVFLLARSCYQCHLVDDQELVEKSSHPIASKNFDLIRWSQGAMRHNFYRTDGKSNAFSEPSRLRKMYLADLLAGIEFGLRAIAKMKPSETRTAIVAETATRISKLKTASRIAKNQALIEIVKLADSIDQQTGSTEELDQTANQIRVRAFQFIATVDSETLNGIDQFLPSRSEYR